MTVPTDRPKEEKLLGVLLLLSSGPVPVGNDDGVCGKQAVHGHETGKVVQNHINAL